MIRKKSYICLLLLASFILLSSYIPITIEGKAVVCTRVGEIDQFLTDGVDILFVQPGDIHALADGIRTLLIDKVKAQQIGLRRRESAKKYFDYRPHTKYLYEFIQELKS
jgi:glycosyltransferase involved in cell wall biosynthesis